MPTKLQEEVSPKPAPQGRLQRGPTASGYRVATFQDVVMRHGGVMGAMAALCLMTPGALSAVSAGTMAFAAQPANYVIGVLGLLVFFYVWSRRRPVASVREGQWLLYLLFISGVEEISFRLILPGLLTEHSTWLAANIASNVLFAGIHYVTLRWKLTNCVVTFLGGMGLSHLMSGGDFVLVVLVHWLGTFLNTPFPPSLKHKKLEP